MAALGYVVRAPYVPAFAGAGARPRAATGGCGCARTGELQRALGIDAHDSLPTTGPSLRAHLRAEDKGLIAALRKVSRTLPEHSRVECDEAIGKILADHARFDDLIDHGKLPTPDELAAHAAYEDATVRRFEAPLRTLVAARVQTAGRARTGEMILARPVGEGPIASPAVLATTPGASQKFMDPRFDEASCGLLLSMTPYDYLRRVPRRGKDRIAAMRAKIEANGTTKSRTVEPFEKASIDSLRKVALDLANRYADAAQWEELAKQGGVPLEKIKAEAKTIQSILDAYSPGTGALVEALYKQLGDRMFVVLKDVAGKAAALAGTTAGGISSSSLLRALGDAASVLGPFLTAIANGYSDQIASRNKAFGEQCADYLKYNVVDRAEATQNAGFPPPLHVLDDFDLACAKPESLLGIVPGATKWVETDDQRRAGQAYKWNLDKLSALPISRQAPIVRWWALAVTLMSDPNVGPAFRALGNDANGGTYASDEQVLLVAAPIAVAYGLNVDDFAAALWNTSNGWRDGGDALKPDPMRQWHYDESGDIVGDPSRCVDAPANAHAMQWSVLARDAFILAENVKAGKVPGVRRLSPGADSEGWGAGTWTAIGVGVAAALGGLWWGLA